jgi:hypothetical protein
VHVHLNLLEHVAMVPEERWRTDWALESGHLLPVEGAFVGFTPYGDMVSGVKGADLGIFDFLPRRQLEIMDREGLRQLRRDAEGPYFDTSAVINPETCELAFDRLPVERILFGTSTSSPPPRRTPCSGPTPVAR